MTDQEEHDTILRRASGVLETLDDKERERVLNSHDPQLDRATDLLKGINLFTQRAASGKMAAR